VRFVDFLRDFLGNESTVVNAYTEQSSSTYELQVEMFAVRMAINMIAGAVAKCEIKTFEKYKEKKGKEYYLWNVEPNINQNSTEFIQELVSQLILKNECLVVEANGQLIVAESFEKAEYALLPTTFTRVTRKEFTFEKTFYMQDVLYFKLNNTDIAALLGQLLAGYSTLLSMSIKKYKRSGGRKGIAKISKGRSGDANFQKNIEKMFTTDFKNYFEKENAVVPLMEGIDYTEIAAPGSTKAANEISDITNITKEAFARVAQAFRIPPALLQGETADMDSLINDFLTFGIDPIADLISTEINRKRNGEESYLKGTFLKIDTTCIKHVDIFDIAEQADKLIASGVASIDELREKIGLMPLLTWWSQKHWMTKNYETLKATEAEQGKEGGNTDGKALGTQTGRGSKGT